MSESSCILCGLVHVYVENISEGNVRYRNLKSRYQMYFMI